MGHHVALRVVPKGPLACVNGMHGTLLKIQSQKAKNRTNLTVHRADSRKKASSRAKAFIGYLKEGGGRGTTKLYPETRLQLREGQG